MYLKKAFGSLSVFFIVLSSVNLVLSTIPEITKYKEIKNEVIEFYYY